MDELTLCPLVSIHGYGGDASSSVMFGTLEGYSYGTDLYEVGTEDRGVMLCYVNELKAENEYGAALLNSIKEGFTPADSVIVIHRMLTLCYKDVPYEVIAAWPKETLKRIGEWASSALKGKEIEEPTELRGY